MKHLIFIAVLVVVFVLLAKTSINFNPFKIAFKEPFFAIGWILVVIGVHLIVFETREIARHEGYSEGVKDMSAEVLDHIKSGELFK